MYYNIQCNRWFVTTHGPDHFIVMHMQKNKQNIVQKQSYYILI